MVDGFTNGSESDIAGNSIGKPPACSTPRFTSSARSRRCVWQKLRALQVLIIPMTGLPVQSAESKPPCRSRERCPKARRSLTPSQRWLRSSSGRLRVLIRRLARVLVDRKIGRADHFFPFRRFVRDELAKIGRRARDRRAAKLLKFGDHGGIIQRKIDLLVEKIDDLPGGSMRHAK